MSPNRREVFDAIPEAYFRKAIDLNRYSNSVARDLMKSYERIIRRSIAELERIEAMPSAKRPKFRARRLKALIRQNTEALANWSNKSSQKLAKELAGLADIEVKFTTGQLRRALPEAAQGVVRTVEVTPAFAEAVVTADPTDIGTSVLSDSLEEVVEGSSRAMKLTARQGAAIRMPGGFSVAKSFRGLAEKQAEIFASTIQDGLLTGESTKAIARRLIGEGLSFSTEAKSVRQLAQAGGQLTKMATHQVTTLVRTSVNATANAASQRVYKANPQVTKKYRWLATLDGRTTAICRSLDQQVFEYGKGPTPANPPHFGCRSTTVAEIDYDGLSKRFGIDMRPEPSKIKRPSSEGAVPLGTSYGKWLHDQRPKGKKFEASAAQAKSLNGGKDTPGARQKARYFNRLADKYGPDEAMKKFLREDGTEVSLADLKKRYGEPERITATKTKAKPKPKTKPTAAVAAAPKPTPKAAAKPKATVAKQKDELQKLITKAEKTAKQQVEPIPADLQAQIAAKEKEFKELNLAVLNLKGPDTKGVVGKATKAKADLEALKLKNPAYLAQKKAEEQAFAAFMADVESPVELPPSLRKAKPPFEALKRYTGTDYREMRAEQFRAAKKAGKSLSRYEQAQVDIFKKNSLLADDAAEIESFLKRAPKFKGEVYRGINVPQADLDQLLAQFKKGESTLAMESWTSTEGIAFDLGKQQQVLLRTQNKRGVDVGLLSEHPEEAEVLMPQGVGYKLKGVTKEEISPGMTKKGIFRWVVDLEQT